LNGPVSISACAGTQALAIITATGRSWKVMKMRESDFKMKGRIVNSGVPQNAIA
jgi:hypothetical protein